MKRLRGVSLLSAAVLMSLAVGTAVAAGLVAPKTVTFKGSYAGTVTEKVDGQTVTALANAIGTGTVIGKGKLTGVVTGTTANPPCSPLSGPGSLTGRAGKLTLTLLPTSQACAASQEDQNNVTFSGNAKVTRGTLKLKKARGTLHFSGHYDRAGGSFDVKLTGRLTY
jgi:hypothetical protein